MTNDTRSAAQQALAHVTNAIRLLSETPPRIANAQNHLANARIMLMQINATELQGAASGGGLSPALLIGGAVALYLFSKKR